MFVNAAYNYNVAVISDSGQQLSYSDLHAQASQLFSNIRKRTLVFCLCKNVVESLVGYVAFINNRVVPLMLDATMEFDLLSRLLEAYTPEYIWLPTERSGELNAFQSVYEFQDYTLLRSNVAHSVPLHNSLALLLTTSGSTGSPKLVRLSYENVLANAQSIAEYLSIDDKERPITTLPMHYSFGLSVINSHLLRGATILLTNRSLMEKEFWQFLKNEKLLLYREYI
jgi:acyl-CoA synthetase (AMP-forming)/AMP-acid ligase II